MFHFDTGKKIIGITRTTLALIKLVYFKLETHSHQKSFKVASASQRSLDHSNVSLFRESVLENFEKNKTSRELYFYDNLS